MNVILIIADGLQAAALGAYGNDWLPTSEVIIRRTYTYSDTEALAKEYQEQRLWREMQTDAVQQIVRRLQSARVPAA